MICNNCHKEIENEGRMVLLNADGDFACSPSCAEEYKKKMNHFLNVIIHDDKLYNRWLKSEMDNNEEMGVKAIGGAAR